jgi:hypothetical protein
MGRRLNLLGKVMLRAGFATVVLLGVGGCPVPPPPTATLVELQPNYGRGGHTVAVTAQPGFQTVIAASESGGLFLSKDGGQTWSHIDSLPAFRMSDVAFAGQDTPLIVVATATDANPNPQANLSGIWASNDSGATWMHVALSASCSSAPVNAFGIAYLAVSTVFVATNCGLVENASLGTANWTQTSNWQTLNPFPIISVTARVSVGATGSPNIIDICFQGGGQSRSVDSGKTWSPTSFGPDCQSPHSLATSPLDVNVVLATSGQSVLESDNGGLNWIDLKAGSNNIGGRPTFVATNFSADQNPAHFDLYFAGRQVTCSKTPVVALTGQRCPTDVGNHWNFLPSSSLNHDINGVALNPIPFTNNCAMYMAADFGVYKMGNPSPGLPCGDPSAWSIVGNSGAGYGALQLYQVAGQLQFPIIGGGVNISGHTSIFVGTQDNGLAETFDAGVSKWQCFGAAGSCDPEGSFLQAAATPQQSTLITLDSLDQQVMKKTNLDPGNGVLSDETAWTSVTPPGNNSDPFFVSPNTYVEWSGGTLFLTQDSGQSWVPVGSLPTTFCQKPVTLTPFIDNHAAIQVANTGQGPAVLAMVADSNGNQGLALLARFIPPPAVPIILQIQTLAGENNRCLNSQLRAIWGNCFGKGFYCAPVFAADPNDFRHVFAVDSIQKFVAVSADAGETWREDIGLTNLVTANGVSISDSIGNSQVHTFAFDPGNSAHILAGTDQAGIFASANGGLTWRALPNTARATNISSFFFDDRTGAVFVGTYGRGMWKLTLDWNTVQ